MAREVVRGNDGKLQIVIEGGDLYAVATDGTLWRKVLFNSRASWHKVLDSVSDIPAEGDDDAEPAEGGGE